MKSKTRISKFFETLIYTILLSLPLISVFARVIYTQSNNHSYMSYSDTSSLQFVKVDETNPQLVRIGGEYYFSEVLSPVNFGSLNSSGNYAFYWSECSYDFSDFNLSFTPSGLSFSSDATLYYYTWFFNPNNETWIRSTLMYYSRTSITTNFLYYANFEFTLSQYNTTTPFYLKLNISKLATLMGKLDNAFDYGLQKTIDDFGTGNINFVNWFGTMFSNNTNLLYINFVNMYLNYALWVSVGYLLYYFLNWFIRFVRETLDRLIYKETNS